MSSDASRVFLCADLDRTILPNGEAPESPSARPRLRKLAARREVALAYVSGRRRELISQAIEEYAIPVPAFAVGDVGSSIFHRTKAGWEPSVAWREEIAADWGGRKGNAIAEVLAGAPGLQLQEPDSQNDFKVSYYTSMDASRETLLPPLRERLERRNLRCALIWSVDEEAGKGLLDILPARATKLHAVEFLMRELGFQREQTVFAGDSGNDLPALTSGLQAVLVRNAAEAVRREAVELARRQGAENALYLARGDFHGMNGNYAAGVLEGLAHFRPHTAALWEE